VDTPDGAGNVRRVAVTGLHQPVVVARREEHHFLGLRRLDHEPRVGADARAPREDAEVQRFQHREGIVRPLDEQHRLPRIDLVAVIQRVHDQLVPALGAQLEDRDRLVDAPQVGVRFAEYLHRHARPVLVFAQQVARADEVFVGVVALPHFVDGQVEDRRIETLLALSHQRGPGQANVAASVSPVGSGSCRATLLRRPQIVPSGSALSGRDTRRQTMSASSASARSRDERGGSGRVRLTTSVVARPLRTSWTTRDGCSGIRSIGRGALTVSPARGSG